MSLRLQSDSGARSVYIWARNPPKSFFFWKKIFVYTAQNIRFQIFSKVTLQLKRSALFFFFVHHCQLEAQNNKNWGKNEILEQKQSFRLLCMARPKLVKRAKIVEDSLFFRTNCKSSDLSFFRIFCKKIKKSWKNFKKKKENKNSNKLLSLFDWAEPFDQHLYYLFCTKDVNILSFFENTFTLSMSIIDFAKMTPRTK